MANNDVETLSKGSGTGNTQSMSRAEADSGIHDLHQQKDALQEMETPYIQDSRASPSQEAASTHTQEESRVETDSVGRAHVLRQEKVRSLTMDAANDHSDSSHSLILQHQEPVSPHDPGEHGPIESIEADTSDELDKFVPLATRQLHISLCQVQQLLNYNQILVWTFILDSACLLWHTSVSNRETKKHIDPLFIHTHSFVPTLSLSFFVIVPKYNTVHMPTHSAL